MAHVDDETLLDLKRELSNFQHASGNRDYEASLLAGAAQELLEQAQSEKASDTAVDVSAAGRGR
ncbi:MAG: hypothetical protein PHQ28_00570 [Mycobacterium sp.]|nr:hypothetical protein [Mycobacterium sp.]